MTNREVAAIFDRIADMLQIKDEQLFKIKAYRQAANSIYHLDEDIHYLYEQGRLQDIPGVGQAIKAKIEELVEKGSSEYYNKLLEEIPAGVLDMLAIPGIGHKTVKTVYEKLGVRNLEELLEAAETKKIRSLPGMGGKTEYNIIKGIEMLEKSSEKNTRSMPIMVIVTPLAFITFCHPYPEFDNEFIYFSYGFTVKNNLYFLSYKSHSIHFTNGIERIVNFTVASNQFCFFTSKRKQ